GAARHGAGAPVSGPHPPPHGRCRRLSHHAPRRGAAQARQSLRDPRADRRRRTNDRHRGAVRGRKTRRVGRLSHRRHPGGAGRRELAGEVLPPVLISRAEQAAEHQARGIGYGQSPGEELPVIASAIISNNIAVAFWAFVGGMLAGTLTALVLVGNGVSLGMGFGLFVNYHAGAYLATFVAGHGILALTAIFIAGGAGFRPAGALLLPGDLTPKDALVLPR